MESPRRKVGIVTTSATAGLSVAGALAVIIAWVCQVSGVELPEAVVAALTTVLGAIGTIIGGYLVRPSGGAHSAE